MKSIGYYLVALAALMYTAPVCSTEIEELEEIEDCIAKEVLEGKQDRSAADIKRLCRDRIGIRGMGEGKSSRELTAIELRGRAEAAVEESEYVLTAYHPSYIMGTYDADFDAANTPFAELDPDFESFKEQEIKYQVSTKALISCNLFDSNVSLYAA